MHALFQIYYNDSKNEKYTKLDKLAYCDADGVFSFKKPKAAPKKAEKKAPAKKKATKKKKK